MVNKIFINLLLSNERGMTIEMTFRTRLSRQGEGRYIIYIPSALVEKAKQLHEGNKEVIVIVITEG